MEHSDEFFTSLAGFVDTLPDSEKARLTVSVKLQDKKFSYDLTDKSSKRYKELKTTVVEAVSVTFMLFVSFFTSVSVSERANVHHVHTCIYILRRNINNTCIERIISHCLEYCIQP